MQFFQFLATIKEENKKMLILFLAASLTVNLTVNHNEVVNYLNLPHIYFRYICQLLMFVVLIVSAEVKKSHTVWQHSFFKPQYPDKRVTVKSQLFLCTATLLKVELIHEQR